MFQEQKNEELNVKLQSVSLELTGMQQQFFEATKIHQETIHRMEEALSKERKLLADTEDELRLKNQVYLLQQTVALNVLLYFLLTGNTVIIFTNCTKNTNTKSKRRGIRTN